jgi:hypothetical protein
MRLLSSAIIVFLFCEILLAQNSGVSFHRSAVLNGNQVKTVFGNWGVIGQPAGRGPRGAWIFDTNGYIGDVSPMVGAEVIGTIEATGRDTTFFWFIDCPADRPARSRDESRAGVRQAFEPVSGYFNEGKNSPALSSDPLTWPPFWPDIQNPDNPRYDPQGWAGSWNGQFGRDVFNADLETYFVMDDNNDNEYSIANENDAGIVFVPDPDNPLRRGLGLEIQVRGLQWQQFLAQDNIFWLYSIQNNSTVTYSRTVFGMLVGTYVGVTGTDDSPQEYDDDWSFFDVEEDLTYTGDYPLPGNNNRNPFWQGKVGLVGYAFLESPGNRFDGIDNDNDADVVGIASAPRFEENDFDSVTVTNSGAPGSGFRNKFVTISTDQLTSRGNFTRTVITFPPGQDTLVVVSMGDTITLINGVTRLVEGNVLGTIGNERVNQNSFDGKDNDLDGLIDENFFLHFKQRRAIDDDGVIKILFELENPVRYVDYLAGIGTMDLMIDENRADGLDNDGDWNEEFDDVGRDGRPDTGDLGEDDGMPTAGEPNFDGTDQSESDQIGLSSFQYFTPANDIALADERELRNRMRPGFFEVPTNFTSNQPQSGEDGDFLYGSGYFPLISGQVENFSLALIYAFPSTPYLVPSPGDEDKGVVKELVKKLETVRDIFDADYRFPVAPEKPTMRAVAGDNQVTLYWDRIAERSFDPVLREFDFEGYKIYKATDPNFNDARVVTNSTGTIVGFKPLAQFDLRNNITGLYQAPPELFQDLDGADFDLGDDTGLRHTFVDTDVLNGRTYYYAVVAYDRGDEDPPGVLPSENTKKITQLNTGEIILDINTAVVVPTKPKAGFSISVTESDLDRLSGEGAGNVSYKILDPSALTGNTYEVYFTDWSNDLIDNNKNWSRNASGALVFDNGNFRDDVGADGIADTDDEGEGDGVPTQGEPNFDFKDPKELEAVTSQYFVLDLSEYLEEFEPNDTFYVNLLRKNYLDGSVVVRDPFGNVVDPAAYDVDSDRGRIRAAQPGALGSGDIYKIHYQYHPVYASSNINAPGKIDPEDIGRRVADANNQDSDNFDGFTLNFQNTWETEIDDSLTGWNSEDITYGIKLVFEPINVGPPIGILQPLLTPANYEVRMSDQVVDTTSAFAGLAPQEPRKFEIINTTGNYQIEFLHLDTDGDQYPSEFEDIFFVEKDPAGEFSIFAWEFALTEPAMPYTFVGGEILSLRTNFPLNRLDRFELSIAQPTIDTEKEKNELDEIQVYPNPYIAAHEFEPPLPPNVTTGRGERIIFFAGIPDQAKIHIFTARGEHVVTLDDNPPIFAGTLKWNLKSKENLDIAYGVYFYVVESPAGIKRGKLAIIK